jgi:hypothetical protein
MADGTGVDGGWNGRRRTHVRRLTTLGLAAAAWWWRRAAARNSATS